MAVFKWILNEGGIFQFQMVAWKAIEGVLNYDASNSV